MPREKITVTEEFKNAVAQYQDKHKIKSWSQAILSLAALGYAHETGVVAPSPYPDWGGWRGEPLDDKKVCKQCHIEKSMDSFSPSNLHKDGRLPICRICRTINNRKKREEMSSGAHYVYALVDPQTLVIRYIGKTAFLKDRVKWHVSDSRLSPHLNPPKSAWINALTAKGLKPEIRVIEECTKDNVAIREDYWIKFYKKEVPDLLNG